MSGVVADNIIHSIKYHICFHILLLRLITRFTAMLRSMITLGFWRWIISFVLLVLCAAINPVLAGNGIQIDTEKSATLPEQLERGLTQTPTPQRTTKSFNFADVYKIELHLDIPGNIKIVALDSNVETKDTISVTLEKRVLNENQIFTKEYLENITLTSTQKDGVLQLNSQLPEDTPNQTSEETDLSEIKKDLQLNYEIKTPPDVSVDLSIKVGDIYVHHLRGKINITNELGNVHLDETTGNYQVETYSGRIHGQILLATGQNEIKTQNGSIDLSVLDELAAPLDFNGI